MTTFLNYYLEVLKSAVLTRSGFKSIAPGDCKVIAYHIFEATKQSVSETTLKRVYGFAYSKFRPSLFTIDAMAKFCGYAGWDDFCRRQEANATSKQSTDINWETLKTNAAKITSFTLQALKNKSGVPYTQTIGRAFIHKHLDVFSEGDYTATVFAAPAGYGKTIALCHWIDDALTLNSAGASNDIILFFSSSALMNVFLSGRDLNDWFLGLLGYTTDKDIRTLIDNNDKKAGNFYLIIDGLDEHSYKTDQFQLLLNQVNDLSSLYRDTPWFKLILTMRGFTWMNNRHLLQSDNAKWYTPFKVDKSGLETNVPLFTTNEIKELCLKINPAIQNFLSLDIAENFNHPLYFQFYYKEYKDDFTLNNVDHVCLHELISNFVLNKVYLGHYSAEKLLFLNHLVDQMDLKNKVYDINKLKINGAIKQYSHAYQELLSVGFLREINISNNLQYKTVIQFGNCNFLDFTIAKSLLEKNDYKFDDKLIDDINDNFDDKSRKVFVIKWCVIYAAKTGQQGNFDVLANAKLTASDKGDLLIFLGELLEKSCSSLNKNEAIINFFAKDCSDKLFNYFFGIEFLSTGYKKPLLTLLKFNLSSRKKIVVYTALASIAMMQLDVPKLEEALGHLRQLPEEELKYFPIDPLACIDAIYQFFVHGIIQKDFFRDVTRFYFNPPHFSEQMENDSPAHFIFLVAGYSMAIYRKPRKTLRYIHTLEDIFKTCLENEVISKFFLEILKTDSYYLLGQNENMNLSFAKLDAIYTKGEHAFTPFIRCVYYAAKIKMALIRNQFNELPAYIKVLNDTGEATGMKLSRLFVFIYILGNQNVQLQHPEVYTVVQAEMKKILRETGLSSDIFFKPYVVN